MRWPTSEDVESIGIIMVDLTMTKTTIQTIQWICLTKLTMLISQKIRNLLLAQIKSKHLTLPVTKVVN